MSTTKIRRTRTSRTRALANALLKDFNRCGEIGVRLNIRARLIPTRRRENRAEWDGKEWDGNTGGIHTVGSFTLRFLQLYMFCGCCAAMFFFLKVDNCRGVIYFYFLGLHNLNSSVIRIMVLASGNSLRQHRLRNMFKFEFKSLLRYYYQCLLQLEVDTGKVETWMWMSESG
jgi:hypothetical protein